MRDAIGAALRLEAVPLISCRNARAHLSGMSAGTSAGAAMNGRKWPQAVAFVSTDRTARHAPRKIKPPPIIFLHLRDRAMSANSCSRSIS